MLWVYFSVCLFLTVSLSVGRGPSSVSIMAGRLILHLLIWDVFNPVDLQLHSSQSQTVVNKTRKYSLKLEAVLYR